MFTVKTGWTFGLEKTAHIVIMFREQHHDNNNRYDKHINMFPPTQVDPSIENAPQQMKPVFTNNNRSPEVLAPYPLEDVNEVFNSMPPFASMTPTTNSSSTRPIISNQASGENTGNNIHTNDRYDFPFQFPNNSSHSLEATQSGSRIASRSSEDDLRVYPTVVPPLDGNDKNDGRSAKVSDIRSKKVQERIVPPPSYEESESRILQEKAYRTEEEPTKEPPKERKRDLSQYSPSGLRFYEIYMSTISDSTNFTPEIQMKWCETLLEYAFVDEFLSHYNINAEKLKRELRPDEILKNQKVILEHSFKVLTKLITLKWGPAMYLMATLYSHQPYLKIKNKNIVVRNDKKALEYYCRASKLNHSDACYRAGVCYEFQRGVSPEEMSKQQSLRKAFQYYERGAQLCSNSACMYKLGMFHLYGDEYQDVTQSIEWFKKAAKVGDSPQALYELGKIYEFSSLPLHIQQLLIRNETRRDPSLALKYFHKCAMDCDYPLAQWKLGYCYEFGELQLPVIAKKSIAWYAKAALAEPKANAMAMLALSGWYLTGASGVLKPNDKEAFKWALKSCETSDGKMGRAEYALAYYYENGIGCEPDIMRSKEHYDKAARLGHSKAIDRVQKGFTRQ